MPWKGGGESRQVKCNANSTNKSKSNVITRQSNKVRQGEPRRCTRTRQTAAQGRQCNSDASLHMAYFAGAGMTSLDLGAPHWATG